MEPVKTLVGPIRPQFVLFGSSIVQYSFDQQGWGAILANTYTRKADVTVRGYAGWNSRQALQVLYDVFPKGNPIQPSLVILYFGGNDSTGPRPGGPHVPLDEYVNNMKIMASYIQSLSSTTRVLFLSTPPMQEYLFRDANGWSSLALKNNELHKTYSDALIKLAKEMNITVIDMFNLIVSKPGWWKNYYINDGLHFTAEGSAVVAAEIFKVLKEADWGAHLHYTSLPLEFEHVTGNAPSKL